MSLPGHLFAPESDGALYDTRLPNWSHSAPLRLIYRRTFSTIETTAELRATMRAGAYAWPGGYPRFFVTNDGAAISFAGARQELRNILAAISSGADDGWRVVGCAINYEDPDLECSVTGAPIESAYGDDSESAQ